MPHTPAGVYGTVLGSNVWQSGAWPYHEDVDTWEIDVVGLPIRRDRALPGARYVNCDVPPERLTLVRSGPAW